jgi:hypothetical protein
MPCCVRTLSLMEAAKSVLSAVALVALFDWLAVTRWAALFGDLEYRYFPPTLRRLASILVVTVTASVSALTLSPGNMPVWPVFIWALVLGLWMFVAVDDIARQRAIGRRTPKRYSERDY